MGKTTIKEPPLLTSRSPPSTPFNVALSNENRWELQKCSSPTNADMRKCKFFSRTQLYPYHEPPFLTNMKDNIQVNSGR